MRRLPIITIAVAIAFAPLACEAPSPDQSRSEFGTAHASARGEKARREPFVASIKREPFHRKSCRWAKKIATHNLVGYASRADAIADGHRPCKICRP